MQKFFQAIFFSLSLFNVLAVAAQTSNATQVKFPSKSIIDVDVDIGVLLKKDDLNLLSRLRLGKDWIDGDSVLSLGVVGGKYSTLGLGGGIEGELLHIPSGLWVQAKIITTRNEPVVSGIGIGWSLLGIEGLISPVNKSQSLVIAKIRLPIGLLTQ